MNTLQDNLEFGEKMELEVLPILQKYFNDPTIKRNPNRKSVLDYLGNRPREIKSRHVHTIQYSTTILPVNKVEMTQHLEKDFIFLFTNALGFISYNHEKFSKYKTQMIMGKHFDGDYEVLHYLIPIKDLTWIYKKSLLF
jgi:hypothetical protein